MTEPLTIIVITKSPESLVRFLTYQMINVPGGRRDGSAHQLELSRAQLNEDNERQDLGWDHYLVPGQGARVP